MKLTIYNELKKEIFDCNNCSLGCSNTGINPHVMGSGNLNSKIMFIAEAPGENETLSGEVLTESGRSGKQFSGVLKYLGLERSNVYTTNLIVCRPPENRDPTQLEIAQCSNFIEKQIELVKPNLIVCFGRISAKYFLGNDFKITKQHGQIFKSDKFKCDIFVLYHFVYVSAYSTQQRRKEFKQDIEKLKKIINFYQEKTNE